MKKLIAVSLTSAILPVMAYDWNGDDGSVTLGDVSVVKADKAATLKGTKSEWKPSDGYSALTCINLISATTLSSLAITDGVDFIANAGTLDQGDGALPATIAVNHSRATFKASVANPITSTSTISGDAGVVAFTGDGTGGAERGDSTYEFNGQLATNWSNIANTRLSDLKGLAGKFRSTYSGNGYFFENTGSTASIQLQSYAGAGCLLCAIIDFKQVGVDIQYRLRRSVAYYSPKNNPGYEKEGSYKFIIAEQNGGTDKIYPTNPAGAGWSSYWFVSQLAMSFASKPGTYLAPIPQISLDAASSMTANSGALIEFGDVNGSPVEVTVNNVSAFKGADGMTINSNAVVTLVPSASSSSAGYGLSETAWYVLKPMAKMISKGYFSIGKWQGVELYSGAEWEQQSANGTYISNLRYHDGATSIGNVNIGNGSNPEIKVDGVSKASIHVGNVNIYTYTALTTTFNIADATGDDNADFIIRGKVSELVAGSNNDMKFLKKGAGTLRFEGAISVVRYPFQLSAGAVELGSNDVATASLNWVAKGASTLACAAKSTNAIGNVALEANLTINVKENAELSIASISEWATQYPAVRLNLVTAEGARVRIGTTAADLPVSVRARMRLNGKRCQTDADGYVEYADPGFILLFE